MSLEAEVFIASLTAGFVFSVGFFYYCVQHRDRRGAKSISIILAGGLSWILARFLQILTPADPAPSAAVLFRLLGPEVIIIGFVFFGLEYTGRDHLLSRRLIAVLSIKPALTVLVVQSPLRDRLLTFRSPDRMIEGFDIVVTPFFAAHILYSYALTMVGIALLLHMFVKARYTHQRQIAALCVAFLIPIAGNVLYNVFGVVPYDPTPAMFSVTTAVLMFAVFRLQFLDALPVARRTVLAEMDDIVFLLDQSGTVSEVNNAATETFDAAETLEDRPITDTLGDDVDLAVDGTKQYDITTTVDGQTRHFTVTQSELSDYREVSLGQLLVCRDITDRIRREEKLQRKNERLEQFASIISHDLRNPLHTASGFLQIAEETGDEEYFGKVKDAHERMDTMIEAVLTLTRAEAELDTADLEPVALGAVVEDAWETAETPGGAIESTVPEGWTVQADPVFLRNVLENLFRNAVEHGSTSSQTDPDDAEPSVTVTVGTFERSSPEDDGTERGFYVADDGTGIPDDEREAVFDHGYTTNDEGTGFGLAIVRDLVEAHGWEISATESEDGGARFDIVV